MTKLEEIVAYKKEELQETKRLKPLGQLERRLKQRSPVRSFQEAIVRPGLLSLIAEFKRASPSAGVIRQDADPVEIGRIYANAGAQAVSILTDSRFFSGTLEDLNRVKENIPLPVLRKDFLFEEYQLIEAASAGADAVLLIAAILDRPTFKRLLGLAGDLSLDALVEVHTEKELGEVLDSQAQILGVNNRDLHTLEIDLRTTERLIGKIPTGKVIVSESGLKSRQDVECVQKLGAHAVLIGEELMKSKDIAGRVKEMMGN